MQSVLEFPPKIFVQWGAIAQEIVTYLTQRGVSREEISAVLGRVKTRWEQQEPSPERGTGVEIFGEQHATEVVVNVEDRGVFVSRHWKSQPARALIESALADHQRHRRR